MSRRVPMADPLPEEDLKAAVEEFLACALKALEGQIPSQRKLAALLDWPETTLSSALKGRFTFNTWPRICRALGKDPIDALVRGRDVLRAQRESDREQSYREMLERTRAETMIALWKKLPREERARVAERLAQETGHVDTGRQVPQM